MVVDFLPDPGECDDEGQGDGQKVNDLAQRGLGFDDVAHHFVNRAVEQVHEVAGVGDGAEQGEVEGFIT